jgi:hypothetical protein
MLGLVAMLDRLEPAMAILFFAGLILWIGLVLLRAIGKSSAARLRHGRFVLGWMLAGWLAGGAYGLYIRIEDRYLAAGPAFGLLFGWAIGMIQGGIVLVIWPRHSSGSNLE